MLERERFEFIVGLVFLVGITVLVTGVLWAKRYAAGDAGTTWTVRFETVGGLAEGDAVLVAGLRMGKVERVRLSRDEVLAKLSVRQDVQLRQGYSIRVATLNFTGEMGVVIDLGNGPPLREPLPVLHGTPPLSVSTVVEPGLDLVQRLRRVSDTLLFILPRVSRRTEETMDRLDGTLFRLEGQVERGRTDLNASLSDLRATLDALRGTTERLGVRLDTTLGKADTALTSFTATSDTLRLILTRLDTTESTAGRLLRDTTMHADVRRAVIHLDSAAVQIDSLMRDVRENPKRYIHFSLF